MTKNSRAANACKISVLLLFSSILLGCNFAPSYQQPQDVVAATVPDATPAPALAPAVLAAAQADALQWLADDRLRHTVALALHNNRDLRIAADNVAKARAQYGIARADQLPSITAQLQGQRSRSSADVSNSTRLVNEQVSASIGFASYEVDLWGRIRNLNEAAWQQFLQVQENRRGVEIALIAEVANAWLTLAADQERLALAQAVWPALPQALPSSVLLARPDVQAAEHALIAQHAHIGAARAAFFPTISLTASTGSSSTALDALFTGASRTWNFAPAVHLPIFSGGRLRAGLQVAQANQRIALAQYEKTVQTAFREVADVLADRDQWGARLGAQNGVVHTAQKVQALSEARFDAGADDFLTVLDARRSLYAAQQMQISLQLAEQQNRITLWKVLGGQALPAE